MLKKWMTEFVKDEAGQSIVEYTLLLMLIGATSVFVLTLLGLSISQMLGTHASFQEYASLSVKASKSK